MKFPHIIANMDEAIQLFSGLAEGKNLLILKRLLQMPSNASALASELKLDVVETQQGLIKLQSLGLVTRHRDKHWISYSCDNPAVKLLFEALEEISDFNSLSKP